MTEKITSLDKDLEKIADALNIIAKSLGGGRSVPKAFQDGDRTLFVIREALGAAQ